MRLSQAELAEEASLSRNAISDLERGIRARPRADTVDLLAAALGLSPPQAFTLREASRRPVGPPSQHDSGEGWWEVPDFPLVGRWKESAAIDEALFQRRWKLLSFEGEPGIGKSRLLSEAAKRAHESGWRVVAVRCHRGSAREAYGPLQSLVEPFLDEDHPPPGQWEVERQGRFVRLRHHFDETAGPSGTLLVLDDLQWAGDNTLELIHSLVFSRGLRPLLVVCTFESAALPARIPLSHLVGDAERHGLAQRFTLETLNPDDAAALIDARSDGGANLKARVLALGKGNPLYLVYYLAFLPSQNDQSVPPAISDSILQQFEPLSPVSQDILSLIVVSEKALNFAVFFEAVRRMGHSEAEALEAWEEGLRHHLVTETPPGCLACRHELVRAVLAAKLGTARLGRSHRHVALALESVAPHQEPETLAAHFEAAGLTSKAAEYWEMAGKRAFSLLALNDAGQHLRRAIALIESVGAPEAALSATFSLAEVLLVLGRYEDAVVLIDLRLVALAEAGVLEGQARLHAYRLHCRARQVRSAEGLVRAKAFLPIAASLAPSKDLVEFFCHLAYSHYLEKQFAEQREAVVRAQAQLPTLLNPSADLRVAESQLIVLAVEGKYRESAEVSKNRVLPAYLALHDRHKAVMARLNLVSTLLQLGDFVEARLLLDQSRSTEGEQDLRARGFALLLTLRIEIDTGRWDVAEALVQEALALEAAQASLGFFPEILLEAGRLDFIRGREVVADRMFSRARSLPLTVSVYFRLPELLHAEHCLFQGRPDLAVAALTVSLEEEPWSRHPSMDVGRGLMTLARVWVGAERPDEAVFAVDRTRGSGLLPSLAELLLYRGWMHQVVGDSTSARIDLDEALAIELGLGRPHQRAKVLRVLATLEDAPD